MSSKPPLKIERVSTYKSRLQREMQMEVKRKSKEIPKRAFLLEVHGLDAKNPRSWLTPDEMVKIYEHMVENGWTPLVVILWKASLRGQGEVLIPPIGLPRNQYDAFFRGKLNLIKTEYMYSTRKRVIFSMEFSKKLDSGEELKLTMYMNGLLVIEKPAEEVTDEEYKTARQVAVEIEKILGETRGAPKS